MMNNLEWRSVELKEPKEIKALRLYLKQNEVRFETSGAWEYVHFEVLCTDEQALEIERFLNRICA